VKGQRETTTDILRRFYTQVWEKEDFKAIPDYFHAQPPPDLLITDRVVEVDEVHEWMEVLRALVTEMKVTFVHTIEQGD